MNEREVAEDLLEAGPAPGHLLADKGFSGRAFAAGQAARGTAVLFPPGKKQRAGTPSGLLKVIAEWRNRIETTSARSPRMELARHGAHSSGASSRGPSDHRRPHPAARLPHRGMSQPT